MFEGRHTVAQGTVGVAVAIGEFAKLGWNVLIPLNDSQCYDLAVDITGMLKTVQVKTTRSFAKNGKNFIVQLRHVHHNKTENVSRPFDNLSVDFLFVLCSDGRKYLIPAIEIAAKSALTLDGKYDRFLV